MKMFEPILDQKLERFKNSMLEVMHEQSNLFLTNLKSVIPQNLSPTHSQTYDP